MKRTICLALAGIGFTTLLSCSGPSQQTSAPAYTPEPESEEISQTENCTYTADCLEKHGVNDQITDMQRGKKLRETAGRFTDAINVGTMSKQVALVLVHQSLNLINYNMDYLLWSDHEMIKPGADMHKDMNRFRCSTDQLNASKKPLEWVCWSAQVRKDHQVLDAVLNAKK